MAPSGPTIEVVVGNVLDYKCDVLILKFAQTFHGADLEVAKELNLGVLWHGPAPGDFRLMKPDPASRIQASMLFFEGIPALAGVSYTVLRQMCKSAIQHLHSSEPNVKHIALTTHGVNIGMDERESFLALLGGILEALKDPNVLSELERITFVELRKDRAERMTNLLKATDSIRSKPVVRTAAITGPVAQAGLTSKEKPHVFVAMPFTDDMEDVFIFGIQGPVQDAGMLCERVDMDTFTGDILDRIKSRIESASLVIAVLNGANANVYLEVGYAWGKNRKTLLVCKDIADLKFDVQSQRCLIYTNITDLNNKLSKELQILVS